jgi:UDP-N-acetylmuramyl pentapeptide phosphotransferase/UDP-N-acetylglucosamine-1-phosphate transferase
MKNPIMLIRVLLCSAVACFICGFLICTTNPDNVFVGITVMSIGGAIALSVIIPTVKMIQRAKATKKNEERG